MGAAKKKYPPTKKKNPLPLKNTLPQKTTTHPPKNKMSDYTNPESVK
jgi:hypothetical protein